MGGDGPEVVFVIDPGSFVAGTYRGHDGIRTLLRLTAEVFDEFQYELDELVDAGDAVLALVVFERAERRAVR